MPRGRPHLTSNFPMISRGSSYPEENDRDIRGAIDGDQPLPDKSRRYQPLTRTQLPPQLIQRVITVALRLWLVQIALPRFGENVVQILHLIVMP